MAAVFDPWDKSDAFHQNFDSAGADFPDYDDDHDMGYGDAVPDSERTFQQQERGQFQKQESLRQVVDAYLKSSPRKDGRPRRASVGGTAGASNGSAHRYSGVSRVGDTLPSRSAKDRALLSNSSTHTQNDTCAFFSINSQPQQPKLSRRASVGGYYAPSAMYSDNNNINFPDPSASNRRTFQRRNSNESVRARHARRISIGSTASTGTDDEADQPERRLSITNTLSNFHDESVMQQLRESMKIKEKAQKLKEEKKLQKQKSQKKKKDKKSKKEKKHRKDKLKSSSSVKKLESETDSSSRSGKDHTPSGLIQLQADLKDHRAPAIQRRASLRSVVSHASSSNNDQSSHSTSSRRQRFAVKLVGNTRHVTNSNHSRSSLEEIPSGTHVGSLAGGVSSPLVEAALKKINRKEMGSSLHDGRRRASISHQGMSGGSQMRPVRRASIDNHSASAGFGTGNALYGASGFLTQPTKVEKPQSIMRTSKRRTSIGNESWATPAVRQSSQRRMSIGGGSMSVSSSSTAVSRNSTRRKRNSSRLRPRLDNFRAHSSSFQMKNVGSDNDSSPRKPPRRGSNEDSTPAAISAPNLNDDEIDAMSFMSHSSNQSHDSQFSKSSSHQRVTFPETEDTKHVDPWTDDPFAGVHGAEGSRKASNDAFEVDPFKSHGNEEDFLVFDKSGFDASCSEMSSSSNADLDDSDAAFVIHGNDSQDFATQLAQLDAQIAIQVRKND